MAHVSASGPAQTTKLGTGKILKPNTREEWTAGDKSCTRPADVPSRPDHCRSPTKLDLGPEGTFRLERVGPDAHNAYFDVKVYSDMDRAWGGDCGSDLWASSPALINWMCSVLHP